MKNKSLKKRLMKKSKIGRVSLQLSSWLNSSKCKLSWRRNTLKM